MNFIDKLRALDLQLLIDPDAAARIVQALRIVLIVGCLIFGVIIVRAIIDSQVSNFLDKTIATTTTALPEQTQLNNSPKNFDLIVTRNIFGAINVAPVQNNKPETKPVSKLPLTLIGTYVSTGSDSYAIIENSKTKDQDVFTKNETVFEEAVLIKIMTDKVEIRRNGEDETLLLEDIPGVSNAKMEGGVATIGENEFIVDSDELDKSLENLPLLLQQARAVPYFKNGQAIGLRLFAIRPDSLYTKIGLRNGDILMNINGKPLGDLTEAIKLFETLKVERSFTLSLERNRETKEFKYEVR